MGSDGEERAVVSGSIDIPSLIEKDIIPISRPVRLIDLFSNRAPVAGNAFEYFVQTVRTNLATAVADNALKPTSTLTVAAHTDRCRVVAHLSEATPVRLWTDHDELRSWLQSEMVQGVLDSLEQQIINGDPTGGNTESMTGLLKTAGTTQVAFATDALTTMRSAITSLQVLGETPTGWALNPADAQAVDLAKWGTAGGFLSEGYDTGVTPGADPSSNNIFGANVEAHRLRQPRRTVRVWDAVTGQALGQPLTGQTDAVFSVAFSPDGARIVSASADGTLRLWPGPAQAAWPELLCAKLTENMSHQHWRDWVSPDIDYITVCPDLPVAPD